MGIRYDDEQVKRPNVEHEYTPEQILELQRCSEDIWYFMKYVKIVNLDLGEIPFEPYKYQKDLIQKFHDYRFNVGLCSRQSGKCLHASSLITIRNKNTGKTEDITIKDFFEKIRKNI